ncbi:M56 family metallopeptidase [Caulobacter sp.]|uniref:M56 family metallopeptidase n=1 Tax=Caulobacter sp. TaxID=78 RepID=UPI003BA882F9
MTWTLLLALLVKSSLVSGAGLACARFLAQRPVDRVDILRATVCLLLALPVVMNVLPALDLALLPATPPYAPPADLVAGTEAATASAATWPPSVQMVGGLWLLGVAVVVGRLLLGLLTLERWTRQGRPVACADWLAPLEGLSPVDRPGLVSSDRVSSPLSWGVAPGFIVVDQASLAERHAAPAILAHELAHIRRHDWVFLVLSRLALALFWFNPLVWRLHAVLVERSEEAADAAALETVDRALYARTLVRLAAHPAPRLAGPRLATAMAADARTLKTRIACIMTHTSARRRPLTVALTVVALAAVATPLAALGVSRQVWIEAPAPPPPPPPAPPAPPALAAVAAPPAPPALPALPALPAPPPEPPAPPAPPEDVAYSDFRVPTADELRRAQEAGLRAGEARALAVEARRIAAEVRARAGDVRQAVEEARRHADLARIDGQRAREIGERARADATRHMALARVQMAKGAEQMRQGAREMRAEAARLRDPAYRARQIAENRARGSDVTDAELKALADSLPGQADDLERQADRLAEEARKPV